MVLMLKGIDGKAQNLTKECSKEQVVHVIKNGSNSLATAYPAGMPPMMLTEDADIEAVAAYVAMVDLKVNNLQFRSLCWMSWR